MAYGGLGRHVDEPTLLQEKLAEVHEFVVSRGQDADFTVFAGKLSFDRDVRFPATGPDTIRW